MERFKVLCVDDEPHVLDGLSLHLRRGYEVATATSGQAALQILDRDGPFAVILSDMRMPGMDGAALLAHAREAAPDTCRMLLTGHADLQSAIAAVNQGQVFRFLTKPCPPDQLLAAFAAAARQYELVTSERVLLEHTLHGAVKALTDVLALASPLAFGRAGRVRVHACDLADEVGLPDRWQLEVAAMLSQLGAIMLPEETLRKHYCGEDLSAEETASIGRVPTVTDSFLANIPRLEPVRAVLVGAMASFGAGGSAPAGHVPGQAASILRIATAFDELEFYGVPTRTALNTMLSRRGEYDPVLLEHFARMKGGASETLQVHEVPLRSLTVGMTLAQDLRTASGVLLVTRGFVVTPSFLEKLRNYAPGYVKEPVRVTVAVRAGGASAGMGAERAA